MIILVGLKMMKYWKNDDFHQMSFKIEEKFESQFIKVRVLANWVQQPGSNTKCILKRQNYLDLFFFKLDSVYFFTITIIDVYWILCINLFTTSEPPKYSNSNSPNLLLWFFCLIKSRTNHSGITKPFLNPNADRASNCLLQNH